MPRSPREDFEDAWHHVMNRGVARQPVFLSERDYLQFLDCLATAAGESSVEVHGYCLMKNHFHLLIRSREGQVSKFLKLLSGRYTREFNRRAGRDGPLFRGRAYSVLVRDEEQMVQTSRYIHLNPVAAGLSKRPEDWQWSSASAYLNIEPARSWLQTRMILELFDHAVPGGDYRSFLMDNIEISGV